VTPWTYALFGATHLRVQGRHFLGECRDSRTAFAWALGGDLDVNAHKNLALRAIQADYVRVNASAFQFVSGHTGGYYLISNQPSNNLRLSFGVVLTWGGG